MKYLQIEVIDMKPKKLKQISVEETKKGVILGLLFDKEIKRIEIKNGMTPYQLANNFTGLARNVVEDKK